MKHAYELFKSITFTRSIVLTFFVPAAIIPSSKMASIKYGVHLYCSKEQTNKLFTDKQHVISDWVAHITWFF